MSGAARRSRSASRDTAVRVCCLLRAAPTRCVCVQLAHHVPAAPTLVPAHKQHAAISPAPPLSSIIAAAKPASKRQTRRARTLHTIQVTQARACSECLRCVVPLSAMRGTLCVRSAASGSRVVLQVPQSGAFSAVDRTFRSDGLCKMPPRVGCIIRALRLGRTVLRFCQHLHVAHRIGMTQHYSAS